ncbi:MAG TPA: pseudouridine synthase [Polyangiaceae bacterium]|nr:pseudouridine synthase [Polyangiaceae bacterium]
MRETAALTILRETDDLVFIDKPSGIATEPDAKSRDSIRDRLAAELARRGEERRQPHALSRLDLPVSGVVTFAKRTSRALSQMVEKGSVDKLYVAIVLGDLPEARLVEAPVDGRPASTRFSPLARAPVASGAATLVTAEPLTGRFHQIREHAASIGALIVGERRHGTANRVVAKNGRVVSPGRILLHSLAVSIPWPDPRARIGVAAPIPAAFLDTWTSLDGASEAWEETQRACDDWLRRRSSD